MCNMKQNSDEKVSCLFCIKLTECKKWDDLLTPCESLTIVTAEVEKESRGMHAIYDNVMKLKQSMFKPAKRNVNYFRG